jgi:hypothetical protein
MAIAQDAQNRVGLSFGQHRSNLVAEAYYDLLARKTGPTEEDFLTAVEDLFNLHGLNPENPHEQYAHSYPDLVTAPAPVTTSSSAPISTTMRAPVRDPRRNAQWLSGEESEQILKGLEAEEHKEKKKEQKQQQAEFKGKLNQILAKKPGIT